MPGESGSEVSGSRAPDALGAVLDTLGSETEGLADTAASAIVTEIPGFATVPREAIRRSLQADATRAVTTLRSGRLPSASARAGAAAVSAERAMQGVSIEDVIRACRLTLRVVHDRFVQLASAAELDAAVVLHCSNLLWQLGDWFTAIAAVEFRDLHVDLAVRRSVRRCEMLRDLLSGTIPEPELWRAAATLEIDGTQRFAVFCLAGRDQFAEFARHETGVDAVVDMAGRRYGLAAEGRTPAAAAEVAVALGPARPLSRLNESTRMATRLAELVADAEPGVYQLRDMPWSVAAHAEPEVAAHLRRKYLEPLAGSGPFGPVLVSSVSEYLAADLNIAAAARRLVVHPNTLRYRLARYEHLVGVRLSATRTITELTMALHLRLPAADP
jgi:putative transposase